MLSVAIFLIINISELIADFRYFFKVELRNHWNHFLYLISYIIYKIAHWWKTREAARKVIENERRKNIAMLLDLLRR
ncbi:hypothetical protein [Cerasicoccus arenae]|uniref:Uncharacterized protein n=1 Tax=Cerasicoccus arenae TaxID=424488 RepID=A0A8J3GDY3_9BACT|nr:hypothetical protein [Cerasicoccus arenae]MBK1856697.1 hypothetical protein [Cerasicoccus arenae]GHB98981.1 hypothetical protein GCM10007047_13780 [Cerasicoccus arenae]